MSFVRIKTIKGNDYLYLVRSVWENGTCRQEHIKYLGPVAGGLGTRITPTPSKQLGTRITTTPKVRLGTRIRSRVGGFFGRFRRKK